MVVDPDLVAAITVPISLAGSLIAFVHYATKWHLAKVKGGPDVENRLARVEVAIDDMSAELTRMIESQQLVTKLLTERVPEGSHGAR